MRRRLSKLVAVLAAAMVAGCASPARGPNASSGLAADVFEPGVLAAMVDSSAEADRLEEGALRNGYRPIERTMLDGLGLVLLRFIVPEGMDAPTAIGELERLGNGVTAGVIHRYDRETPVETVPASAAAPRLYADALIGWPRSGCPAVARIGMIDGEVDAALLPGADLRRRDFAETAPSAAARRHATGIAEILVGGRLARPQLFAASVVRVDESASDGASATAMIKALDWMLVNEVDVVNISLAGPYNRLLDRAVRRAVAREAIIVAAVGNDGPDAPPRYPAAFAGVIGATAVDAAKRVYPQAIQGEHVDVAAPGVEVYVAAGGSGRYLSGTSIAAPFVTAKLASDPRLDDPVDRAERAGALLAADSTDLGEAGRDRVFGVGLLQAHGACATD